MTVSEILEITCNNCHKTETWARSVLRNRKVKSILENRGYTKKYHSWWEGDTHWCPECNDREKNTFHVYDGHGEEYLGSIEAWGIVNARKVAWDTFDCENMVKWEEKHEQ